MKKYFIFFILLLIFGCSTSEKGQKYTKGNNLKNEIDHSKQYSFEEYVDLLSKTNISKEYPDINNVPE